MARITVTLPDGKTEVINGAINFTRHKVKYADDSFKINVCGCLYTRTYLDKGFIALKSDRVKIVGIDPDLIDMTYKASHYLLRYEFEEAEDMDIFNCIDDKKRDQVINDKWLRNDKYQELQNIDILTRGD